MSAFSYMLALLFFPLPASVYLSPPSHSLSVYLDCTVAFVAGAQLRILFVMFGSSLMTTHHFVMTRPV